MRSERGGTDRTDRTDAGLHNYAVIQEQSVSIPRVSKMGTGHTMIFRLLR